MNVIFRFILYICVFTTLFIIGGFFITGNMTFGHGLGNLYYLLYLVLIIILFLITYIVKDKFFRWIILILISVILTFLILKLTVFRGGEYSWNGNLFI